MLALGYEVRANVVFLDVNPDISSDVLAEIEFHVESRLEIALEIAKLKCTKDGKTNRDFRVQPAALEASSPTNLQKTANVREGWLPRAGNKL